MYDKKKQLKLLFSEAKHNKNQSNNLKRGTYD